MYSTVTDDFIISTISDYQGEVILIEKKIPQSQRDRLWVLAGGSYIAWVEKVRMSDDAKIGPHTERVLHVKGPAAKGENENA